MRIVCLANNWVGWQVVSWLRSVGEEVVGLVIHPEGKQKYAKELLGAAALPEARVFDGSRLQDETVLQRVRELKPDIGVSLLFDYILRPDFIGLFPRGVVNLHPALLPFNRGQYPNVWSIVERTPAGATLHFIDQGVDTGAILAQKEVPVAPTDTGEALYRKLERASVDLFVESWPRLSRGELRAVPQHGGGGTTHRTRDVERIDRIDLDRRYTGRELIDILRARTFPPYPGAYFECEGRRIYLRLQLMEEDALE